LGSASGLLEIEKREATRQNRQHNIEL